MPSAMAELSAAFRSAFVLIVSLDPELLEIVGLSLRVSLSALLLASLGGIPLGALLATTRFPGRRLALAVLNGLMGLPAVVVGLVVYLLLSRSGPLGSLGWLFTPRAIIAGQTLLTLPLVAALSRQVLEDHHAEYRETLRSLGARGGRAVATLVFEARHSLLTTLLAGFGRAITEIGSAIIVGGNIAHATRVMSTAIALETSRGDLALALGLGLVLIGLTVLVNGAAQLLQEVVRRAES